ncbi:MAG: OmpA family protein [Kofleriaceae bacterium]|nr:OmpA family protein [Kofleriaceae bacterium]
MPSVIALRALVGAGLGLGALDLVVINTALAPRLVSHEPAPVTAAAATVEVPTAPAIEPAPPPAPPPVVEPRPVQVISEHVYFATNSADLGPRTRKTLEKLVALAGPTSEIVLEGHADYRGDESLNKTLSKDRATTVQKQLVHLGIERSRIRVGYVGEDAAGDELWRDRRVDIQITGGTR